MENNSTATNIAQGAGTALRNRKGSATIEYALLAAVIAFGALAALAPVGKALSQEIETISHQHFLWSTSAEAGCQRVEWTEAELQHAIHEHHQHP